MTTGKKIVLLIGCIFLVAAVAAWFYAQRTIRQHRWTVLEQPIRFEDGFSLAKSFTVDIPTDYWIEIQCGRAIPSDTLDSILKSELAVTYSIFQSGLQIAEGDSNTDRGGWHSKDHISRTIGTFQARPGQPYNLELRVAHSIPQLASTNPVVKVSVNPILFKNAFVTASLLGHLAIVFAVIAVCFIAPILGAVLSRRSHNNTRGA